jgi:hypothetical protein
MQVKDSVSEPILSDEAIFTVTNTARSESQAREFRLPFPRPLGLEQTATLIFKKREACILFSVVHFLHQVCLRLPVFRLDSISLLFQILRFSSEFKLVVSRISDKNWECLFLQ